MRASIAFRPELGPWLATRPDDVRCLELSVEMVLSGSQALRLRQIRRWPTSLHAPSLSVGTPTPPRSSDLDTVLRAVRAIDPMWICAYLGCRHRPETEPSYPQPMPLTGSTLACAIANCRRLIDAGVRPLLVENVAAFGAEDGHMSPAEFLNKLCDESGCGVLLDVTTLTLDARLGVDPRRWLWDVDPLHIEAMRVRTTPRRHGGNGGAPARDGLLTDETWLLARDVAARTFAETSILQVRGECSGIEELQTELCRLASLGRAAVRAPATELRPAAAHATL
jgi:uncharacterized protein (UPF0276 family)